MTYEEKLARKKNAAVNYAKSVLEKTKVGESVVLVGSCPSGDTYGERIVWDGTEECRAEILKKAKDKASFSAWDSLLERVKGSGIVAAEMRTASWR